MERAAKTSDPAPKNQSAASNYFIRGRSTLNDIQRNTGVTPEAILRALQLPADLSRDRRLGELRDEYDFEIGELRDTVGALLAESEGSSAAAPHRAPLEKDGRRPGRGRGQGRGAGREAH